MVHEDFDETQSNCKGSLLQRTTDSMGSLTVLKGCTYLQIEQERTSNAKIEIRKQ